VASEFLHCFLFELCLTARSVEVGPLPPHIHAYNTWIFFSSQSCHCAFRLFDDNPRGKPSHQIVPLAWGPFCGDPFKWRNDSASWVYVMHPLHHEPRIPPSYAGLSLYSFFRITYTNVSITFDVLDFLFLVKSSNTSPPFSVTMSADATPLLFFLLGPAFSFLVSWGVIYFF